MLLSHHASTYEVMYQISALKLLAHLLFCVIYNQTDHVSLRSQFLCSLSLFAHSGVHHILCCDFFSSCVPNVAGFFVLCTQCCRFLRLVYSMLPVSLDCPFLICPFGIL
jgi:hypothetical protein